MIVIGHRGIGAARRLLLGSVADGLLQAAPKPVLIVR
jgi:nucleotide-binding universal stress UspA family protein